MEYYQASPRMTDVNGITETSKALELWECSWMSIVCVIYCKQDGKDAGHIYQRELMPKVSAIRMCTSLH